MNKLMPGMICAAVLLSVFSRADGNGTGGPLAVFQVPPMQSA
ncbi:MAG TPA: hypothetical protein VMD30_03590 [Tepidisphaeraceae bacterium]|nr:hypothetical protein [Tepidisphaeraceae bacterium]